MILNVNYSNSGAYLNYKYTAPIPKNRSADSTCPDFSALNTGFKF